MPTTAAETFEQLIRQQRVAELMPFLLTLAKSDLVAVRDKTRKLHLELSEHRRLGVVTWGRAGSEAQLEMLFLAGLGTYSQKEALAAPFSNELWRLNWTLFPDAESGRLPAGELVDCACQLFLHRRPEWLDKWLGNTLQATTSATLDFATLLRLEARGVAVLSPRWLALAGANELVKIGTEATMFRQLAGYAASRVGLTASQAVRFDQLQQAFCWRREGEALPAAEDLIYECLARDTALLARAVPLFFEFDLPLDWANVYLDGAQANRHLTWHDMLPRLAAAGRLSRADLLAGGLLALRRDFRRPLLTWHKNLYASLQPTPAERLAHQAELLELLHHPLPLVVNFALEQLNGLWLSPAFDTATLLRYADNLLTRHDLRTGLKTLLGALPKLLKTQPAQAPVLARLYATALSHADAAVQERAAKGLAALLRAKKPLLDAAATAAAIATLGSYANLLGPAARAALAPWLAAEAPAEVAPQAAAYAPLAQFVPELSLATALAPVADWHELLFLTGQVLKHDDPAALERWLDGLLRLQAALPVDYPQALRPYVLQLLPYLEGDKVVAWLAQQKHAGDRAGHTGLVQALLLSWVNGFATPFVARVDLGGADPLVAVERQRLAFAEQLLRARQALPLLSTPTHAPHWVAPTALAERLLAYQAARQEPSPADLALALARTAHAHPAETAAAQALLPALHHAGLRELLKWFLGPAAPLPATVTGRDSLFDKFRSVWAQLRPDSAAPATLAEALPQLWAVAARTRQPAATYPELHGLTLNECPNVGAPWHPRWELQPRQRTYRERWKIGKPEVTERWVELVVWAGPRGGAASSLLLYALHAAYCPPHPEAHRDWRQAGSLAADYPFLVALLPQCPAPLYWHTLRLAATRDAPDATSRTILSHALRSLLGPGAAFDEPAALLLGVGLTHNAATVRALALEGLLAAIEHGRLVPATLGTALGRLLAAGFVPVPRLLESLAQARAISPRADAALRQLLDALLPALPPAPPRNLRQLLDAYADLHGRAPRPVPTAVQAQLRAWQAAAPALKKVSAALLA